MELTHQPFDELDLLDGHDARRGCMDLEDPVDPRLASSALRKPERVVGPLGESSCRKPAAGACGGEQILHGFREHSLGLVEAAQGEGFVGDSIQNRVPGRFFFGCGWALMFVRRRARLGSVLIRKKRSQLDFGEGRRFQSPARDAPTCSWGRAIPAELHLDADGSSAKIAQRFGRIIRQLEDDQIMRADGEPIAIREAGPTHDPMIIEPHPIATAEIFDPDPVPSNVERGVRAGDERVRQGELACGATADGKSADWDLDLASEMTDTVAWQAADSVPEVRAAEKGLFSLFLRDTLMWSSKGPGTRLGLPWMSPSASSSEATMGPRRCRIYSGISRS